MNKTRTWLSPSRIAFTMLIGLVAAFAIGCGSGGGNQAKIKPAVDQTLRLRIDNDVSTFDPQLAYISEEISVAKQLYRGLFVYDDKLNVVPSVASNLPTKENGGISGDALTYTINLRDDATWSDGQPVTAQDFVYAFQRLFDPAAGGQGGYSSFYTAIKGADAALNGDGKPADIGVTAPDAHTLVLQLERPQPTLVTLLALWPASPLRKDVIDQYGDAWTEPGHMISDGPFVLKDYSPNDKIDLASNTNYWGSDAPTLTTLTYIVIPDDSAGLAAYRNNEVDTTSIPVAERGAVAGDKEEVRFGQLETFAIQYNVAKAPFDNKLVRQAISRAIDRDAYVANVQSGVGVPALGWLPPGLPGVTANVNHDYGFSKAGAAALLTSAGYANGEGFPKATLTIPQIDSYQTMAEYLQAQLKDNLGIDLQIEALEPSVYSDRWQQGDFQLALFDWFADYADPEDWLQQQFASDGGYNFGGYSNPDVDALLTQASTELDQQKRLALYEEAHRLIIDDQAVTPIYYPERDYLVKHKVDRLRVTPLDAEPGDWFVTSVQILAGGDLPASEPGQ